MAGARAGLAGERSGLFMEQIRVVKEMRDADERRGRTAHTVRPRYMCWENVPGSFSSAGGEDFRIVLEEIVRIKDGSCSVPRPDSGRWESAGAIILGNQFSLAWRVMDAQFWGVAQRRKRIFLVADFAGRSAPQILFEQNRLPGYSASSGGQRQGTAASAPGCSDPPGGTGPIGFDGYNGDLTGEKAATLGVNCGMSTGRNGVLTAFAANQRDEVRDLHDVAAALTAQPGMKQQTFVAGITAKGNGDCFLSEERHTALSGGGGMPGQGYPAIFTAAFSAGAGASAGSIGYGEEVSPIVFNTCTQEYEEVIVTEEVYRTYCRTRWNIKDNDQSFFDHEIQTSGMIGSQDGAYENFREFIDAINTPEHIILEQIKKEALYQAISALPAADQALVQGLFFKGQSELDYAREIGVSQPAVHKRKVRILKSLKKLLEN